MGGCNVEGFQFPHHVAQSASLHTFDLGLPCRLALFRIRQMVGVEQGQPFDPFRFQSHHFHRHDAAHGQADEREAPERDLVQHPPRHGGYRRRRMDRLPTQCRCSGRASICGANRSASHISPGSQTIP